MNINIIFLYIINVILYLIIIIVIIMQRMCDHMHDAHLIIISYMAIGGWILSSSCFASSSALSSIKPEYFIVYSQPQL